MPWNEDPKKPKSNRNSPPDLDEMFEKFSKFLQGLFEPEKSSPSSSRNSGSSSNKNGFPIKLGFFAVIAIVLGFWVVSGFYIIDQQERGVMLRLGKYSDTLKPGLHWQPPLIDVVQVVNTTRIREMNTQGQMLTKDENIIQASILVQYRINTPKDYILDLRRPELSLSHALDGALRHVIGLSTMSLALTDGRASIAASIKEKLQTSLDSYKSGMEVLKINIESINAPAEVQAAFDDVIKAREDKQRYQNNAEAYANQIIPQARGLAKRTISEAEGYKEQVVNEAKGSSNRFVQLLSEYKKSPKAMRERMYIDTKEYVLKNISKVVIDNGNSNSLTVLPLEQILKTAAANKALQNRGNNQNIIHDSPTTNSNSSRGGS